MIETNFEDLRNLAKLVGYDNALQNVTNKEEKTNTKAFNIYSKNAITIEKSYNIEEETFFIVHKEWIKFNTLEILTSNSFNPSTKWDSLMLCNNKVMNFYNTKEVTFFNDACYVKYMHAETNDGTIENEIIGKGENEFEATYNAILNHIKLNN